MKWVRSIIAGTALAIGVSLTPVGTPAANAGTLITAGPVLTVNAGTVLVLANLFQVSARGAQLNGEITIFLSGGIEFPGGGSIRKVNNFQEMLSLPVIATGVGGNGIVNVLVNVIEPFGNTLLREVALANVTIIRTTSTPPPTTPSDNSGLTSTTLGSTPTTLPATPTTRVSTPTTVPPVPVTLPATPAVINRPPVAFQVSVSRRANLPIQIRLNGQDPEGARLRYRIVAAPLMGRLVDFRGSHSAVYRPNIDFVGSDQFSYTVSDGASTSPPAVVYILVTN